MGQPVCLRAKRWSAGFVKPTSWLPLGMDCEFTQPKGQTYSPALQMPFCSFCSQAHRLRRVSWCLPRGSAWRRRRCTRSTCRPFASPTPRNGQSSKSGPCVLESPTKKVTYEVAGINRHRLEGCFLNDVFNINTKPVFIKDVNSIINTI